MGDGRQERRWRIWACDCGYFSTQGGNCRSHPFPLRAMGPDMGEPVEVMPATDYDEVVEDLVIALEDISSSPYEPSAEDARNALRRLEKRGLL